MGTDLPAANPRIRTVTAPTPASALATVPALNPDVTIVHAQRADAAGQHPDLGLLGVQKEAAFASARVIVVVEELVDEAVIRADPNRTLIPGIDRRRGGGRAVGRAPLVRAGLLRPRQRLLRGVGGDLARPGGAGGAISTSSSTACADRAEYVAQLRRAASGSGRTQRVCAGVNYGF